MKTSEALRQAADLIEQQGWTRGAYYNEQGYCLLGSLRAVTGFAEAHTMWKYNIVNEIPKEIVRTYERAYDLLLQYCANDVIMWNDSSCGSQKEAVYLLRLVMLKQRALEREAEERKAPVVTTEPELEPA